MIWNYELVVISLRIEVFVCLSLTTVNCLPCLGLDESRTAYFQNLSMLYHSNPLYHFNNSVLWWLVTFLVVHVFGMMYEGNFMVNCRQKCQINQLMGSNVCAFDVHINAGTCTNILEGSNKKQNTMFSPRKIQFVWMLVVLMSKRNLLKVKPFLLVLHKTSPLKSESKGYIIWGRSFCHPFPLVNIPIYGMHA